MVGTYCERSRNPKDVVRTQCSLLGRGMNVVEAWFGRDENSMVVARTYWQRSKSVLKSWWSATGPYHVHEDRTRFVLRAYNVLQVLTTSLLRRYCVLIPPRPHHVCFELLHKPATSRPHQVLTAFLPRPTRHYHVLATFSIFRTYCARSENVTWCKWGFSTG